MAVWGESSDGSDDEELLEQGVLGEPRALEEGEIAEPCGPMSIDERISREKLAQVSAKIMQQILGRARALKMPAQPLAELQNRLPSRPLTEQLACLKELDDAYKQHHERQEQRRLCQPQQQQMRGAAIEREHQPATKQPPSAAAKEPLRDAVVKQQPAAATDDAEKTRKRCSPDASAAAKRPRVDPAGASAGVDRVAGLAWILRNAPKQVIDAAVAWCDENMILNVAVIAEVEANTEEFVRRIGVQGAFERAVRQRFSRIAARLNGAPDGLQAAANASACRA